MGQAFLGRLRPHRLLAPMRLSHSMGFVQSSGSYARHQAAEGASARTTPSTLLLARIVSPAHAPSPFQLSTHWTYLAPIRHIHLVARQLQPSGHTAPHPS